MAFGEEAIKMAGGVVGTGLGLATANWQDKRQLKQSEKLQNIQIKGQKEMGEFNKEQALDMWNKTNAEAQRKHLENAGLNVGLMYGGSGAGGATANAPTGNTSGQQAPSGGNEIGMGIQAGLNAMLQKAQIENIEADTGKKKVETAKTAGADTEEILARIPTYGKQIEKTDEEIKQIASQIGVNEETIKKIITEENKNIAETKKTTILTPLEAEQKRKETQLIAETIIRQKIGNKYADSKEYEQLRETIAKISNIKAQESHTKSSEHNEAIQNELEKVRKELEILGEKEKSGAILELLKLIF